MIYSMDDISLEINSLVYFSFGFTLDDNKNTIIERIINKAYNDATMQGAFNTLLGDNEKMKDKATNAKNKVIAIMKSSLSELENSDFKKVDDYDTWHENICLEIKYAYKEINDDVMDRFSYGNSQKVLNMTIKYLFLISHLCTNSNSELRGIFDTISRYQNYLHVPIDSYIIDAIWIDTDIELPLKSNINPDRKKKDYKVPSDYVVGWSNWDKDTYENVQKSLREYIKVKKVYPLTWEEKRWIEISKSRKGL